MGEAPEISGGVAAVATLDARCWRAMYGWAVAFGVANAQSSSDRERRFRALRLLTLATLRLPDVVLYGELLHSYARERRARCVVAHTLMGACAGSMRLGHRALEMHAFEIGYRADAWAQRAVDGTGVELSGTVAADEGLPVAFHQARLATLATASTASEPMLVPGQIADALGHLLVIYLIAVQVASTQ